MVLLVDIENTILILFIVLIIGFGTFFGFVGTSSSANDTTNTTNATNSINVMAEASTPSDPTSSASGINPSVSLSVTSPVDLDNVTADGSEYPYPSITQVSASASETGILAPITDNLNLFVKASGDLTSSLDTIPLSNFQYDGFSNSKTFFTTGYVKIESWRFSSSLDSWPTWTASGSVNGNYYLTVPTGSAAGTYTTTVYYLAIIQ